MSTDIWAVLHVPLPGTELHDFPCRQIAHSSFQALADLLCMDEKTLGMYLGISAETLVKSAKTGLFSVHESKRLDAQIAVAQSCVELFEGDVQAAAAFLRSPSSALNSKAPLEMLDAGGDAGAVIDLIGRLEHGIVV
jgi:putative toxin-antitoxin system antitoxin component (TIGR02293 family)